MTTEERARMLAYDARPPLQRTYKNSFRAGKRGRGTFRKEASNKEDTRDF